ncbi:MAG: prepilin-type N-terminal cleavage/methylation domain-containing protein [Steroidobacteraceae bacterium]
MNKARCMRADGGFTLVELLVAMTLVATLTAGGLAAYARANATWHSQAADQRRHERAQYVFGTLEPDLQMAGYFGPARPAAPLPAAALPAAVRACGIDAIAPLHRAVERFAAPPPACVSPASVLAGSDALLIRRASAQVAAPHAGRAQWLTAGETPPAGALLWDGQIPPAAPGAELRDLVVRIYYVARSADGDSGSPALRVKTLSEVAGAPAFIDTEVMPGVESLQVELLPPTAPRSVRVSLRVRADAADTAAQDARRTLSLTRHFTLRNALPDAP